MTPEVMPQNESSDEYGQLLAELFHRLNQPLTTLSCCLELSLKQTRASAKFRRDMRIALQEADKITRLTAYLRELVGSGHARDQFHKSALDVCLKETIEHLLPLAESAGVRLSMVCDAPIHVPIESSLLKHALFRLVEFVLNCSLPGSEAKIKAVLANHETVLTVQMSGSRRAGKRKSLNAGNRASRAFDSRIALAIARRIFESVHGNLEFQRHAPHLSIQVRLPLAFREPAQPLAWASRCCG